MKFPPFVEEKVSRIKAQRDDALAAIHAALAVYDRMTLRMTSAAAAKGKLLPEEAATLMAEVLSAAIAKDRGGV